MRVYLMRHGHAVDRDDPNCPPDRDRPLTAEGRKRTEKAAQGLKWLGLAPAIVLTSPFLRARETAEIVMNVLKLKPAALVLSEDLLPSAPARKLRGSLRRRRSFEVLCVGHLPHLDEAIAHLLEAPFAITELKKSAVAAIDLPASGPGTIMWLMDPKTLGRLAGK